MGLKFFRSFSNSDDVFAERKEVKSEFKSLQFEVDKWSKEERRKIRQKELLKWQRILSFIKARIHPHWQDLSIYREFPSLVEYQVKLEERKRLLEEIIFYTTILSKQDDPNAEAIRDVLVEQYLQNADNSELHFIYYHDFALFSASDIQYIQVVGLAREKKKELKTYSRRIAALLHRRSYKILRDLRASFRSLVRMLFKNMNDEGDAHVSFSEKGIEQELINKIIHNDRQRDNRTIKILTGEGFIRRAA